MAVTNCLNFGNPLGPEVYYQLREVVAGLGAACRALGTPVTGGNVSLYNETPAGPIYPTPVIGMIGLLASLERRVPSAFRASGDAVWLVGRSLEELGGSEYLAVRHGLVAGAPPSLDLDEAARLTDFLVAAAEKGLLRSAHDCAEGGLAVALAECCLTAADGLLGFDGETPGEVSPAEALSPAASLFGETQSRVVLTCEQEAAEALSELAAGFALPVSRLGTVGERDGVVRLRAGPVELNFTVDRLREAYVRERIELSTGAPLNVFRLRDRLQLLQQDTRRSTSSTHSTSPRRHWCPRSLS